MSFITASEAASLLGAALVGQDRILPQTFKVNSREITDGDVFVARKGKKSDGHLYIKDAICNGAAVVLAQFSLDIALDFLKEYPRVLFLIVEDSEKALVSLAKHWLKKVHPKVIGITGSVGKTTTRELMAHTFAGHVWVHSAIRSYNTLVGCSLTILAMPQATEYLILELGTNHFGEIAEIVRSFPVDSAVITELAPAHLESFGSTEGVLKAKMEIISEGKTLNVSYNYDNKLLADAISALSSDIRTLGMGGQGADFVILNRQLRQDAGRFLLALECVWEGDSFEIILPLFGLQHAHNVAYVYVAARNIGMPHHVILEKFMQFNVPSGRGRIHSLSGNSWLLDESYNSNPSSLEAVLNNTRKVVLPNSHKKIALLGGMRELGEQSRTFHEQLLRDAVGFDALFLVGAEWDGISESGSPIAARTHATEELIPMIQKICKDHVFVLLKGSRFYEMERLIPYLKGELRS